MFSEDNCFPSFFDADPSQQSPLSMCKEASSESTNKPEYECVQALNDKNVDLPTEKQKELMSKAAKRLAASLPTEDSWELLRKNIKKPKKMKVTRTRSICRLCGLGFRKDTIVHRFECLHFCHEDCAILFERTSSKCPFCVSQKEKEMNGTTNPFISKF